MKQWISDCIEAFQNKDYKKGEKILESNYPKSLYKYCRLNEYTIQNLTSQSFYMATLNDLNDPYEFHPTADFETHTLISIIEELPKFAEAGIYFTKDEREELRLSNDRFNTFKKICIGKGLPINKDKEEQKKEFYHHFDKALQDVKGLMRFQSFSEKNHSTVMWSHYADCHKGICIEYAPVSLGNKIPLLQVEYSDNRVDITEIESLGDNDLDRLLYNVMLLKASDWAYEKEWRLLFVLDGKINIDINTPISLPAPKPTAIYLGTHFSKNDDALRNALFDYAKKEQIPLYNMTIDALNFKMVPE